MSTQDKLAEALLGRIQEAWENHSENGRVFISMRDAMELCEQVLPAVIQQAHAADAAHTRIPDLTDDEWMILFHERPDLKDRLNAIFDKAAYLSRYRSQCKTSTEAAQARAQSGEWVQKAIVDAKGDIEYVHVRIFNAMKARAEEAEAMLAAAPQPQAAESHKGLLIGTTPSGVPYSLHGTKESVTAVSDMLEQAEVSRQLGADQPQSAEPVAVIESAEDRHGPYLTHANVVLRVWNGYAPKAGDEIYTHPQPAKDAKDAARYRWLREHHDSTRPDWHIRTPTNDAPAIGALDAAIDAAMAKESGR